MIQATELARFLYQSGAVLEARGDLLHVDAPKGLLTDVLRHEIRANKPALLKIAQKGKEPEDVSRDQKELEPIPELIERAEIFQKQIYDSGAAPFFVMPGTAPQEGACLSCGEAISSSNQLRCGLCVKAAQLALKIDRGADGRSCTA